MKNFISITIILTIFVCPFSFARTWTAKSGDAVVGDFVKLEDGFVYLTLSDGKTAKVPLDQLLDEDQTFVAQQTKKNKSPFVIEDTPPAKDEKKEDRTIVNEQNTVSVPAFTNKPIIQKLDGGYPSFSPDGKLVTTITYSADNDKGTTTIWDIATGKPLRTLQGVNAALSANGKVIATYYGIWNSEERISYRGRKASKNEKFPMMFGWIRLWDVETGKEIVPQTQVDDNNNVAISSDGKLVAFDNYVRNVTGGQKLFAYGDNNENRLPFSFDGNILVLIDSIWDTETGKQISQFDGSPQQILSDIRQLVTSGEYINLQLEPGITRLWDLATGKELHRWKKNFVFFSNDGKIAISTNEDFAGNGSGSTTLWDTKEEKELNKFSGEFKQSSPDCKLLVTSRSIDDYNEKLLLWDTATGKKIREFTGTTVHFSPSGRSLIVVKAVEKSGGRLIPELQIYHRIGVQPSESDFSADSDNFATSTVMDIEQEQPDMKQQTQPRNQQGRRINSGSAAETFDKGLRIYNTIRSFTR